MALVNAPVSNPSAQTCLFPELDRLMRRIYRAADSPLLVEMLSYHLSSGGKQLRPGIILGLGDVLGLSRQHLLGWAAACEMLHNGSLIHDDLQDGDTCRRGQPTVWHRFGKANAINAGNFLLLGGLQALKSSPINKKLQAELCQLYSQMATDIVIGQSLEFELNKHLAAPDLQERYLRCIALKTSALFAAGTRGVGLIEQQGHAELYGQIFALLGHIFQIQDDILDLYGDKGRDLPGCDIREGKISALVVQLLRLNPAAAEWLAVVLAKPYEKTEPQDILRVRHALNQAGVLEQLACQMAELIKQLRTLSQQRQLVSFEQWLSEILRAVLRPVSHLEAFIPLYREEA